MAVTKACLVIIVVSFLLCKESEAQSSCTTTLMGLSPCLNYVSGNTSTPSTSCCTQLTGVVNSQPLCLCLLLNGTASSYGFNINQTLALGLPQACKVETPPASRCDAAAPEAPKSPSGSSPATGSDIPSGSKATPTQTNAGGDNIKKPAMFVLLIASVAAGFF